MNKDTNNFLLNIVDRVVYPTRLCAMFPIRRTHSGFTIEKHVLVCSAVVCCCYSAAFIYFIVNHLPTLVVTYLTKVIDYTDGFLMILVPHVALYDLLRYISDFSECIKAYQDVHTLITTTDHNYSYTPRLWPIWPELFIIACSLSFGLGEIVAFDLDILNNSILIIIYNILFLKMLLFVHRFSELLLISSSLFESGLRGLKLLSKSLAPFRTKRIESLIRAHFKLSEASTILCKICVRYLLLIILISFIISVSGSYELYAIGFLKNTNYNIYSPFVRVSSIIGSFFLCWTIVRSCQKCTEKAQEFNKLLYQLMIDDKTNDISSNKKLRLHIAMKREVKFSACGFFDLDYTLLQSMIAAATTYLVILIQFG